MSERRAQVSSDKRTKANRSEKYPNWQRPEGNGGAELGTPERWQHSRRAMELTERAGVTAARALEESILDILVARRWITLAQREAALRLKLDFHRAGLEAHLSGSYNPLRTAFTPFGPWDERTDAQEAAYQRWRQAVRAIGQVHGDIVIPVACYERRPAPSRRASPAL